MPYKRFATPDLLDRATEYLNDSKATYRSVVRHNRCLIGYPLESQVAGKQGSGKQDVDSQVSLDAEQSVVPPSLVWRFITWMGSLTFSLDKAREMILNRDPNSLCHRISGNVDPFKARSDDRRVTLETAQQLVLIMPEWEELFGQEFFPRFATRAGFD